MANLARGRGGKPQERATGSGGWTKKRRAAFLDALAATCNVTHAAAAAGLSTTSAYNLRRRDGAFGLLWAGALEAGWLRLEDELLARALGTACAPENPDGVRLEPPTEAVREFDPDLAIRLLKMRASNGPRAGRRARPAATQDEVDAELLRRLDAIARQEAVKAAVERREEGA